MLLFEVTFFDPLFQYTKYYQRTIYERMMNLLQTDVSGYMTKVSKENYRDKLINYFPKALLIASVLF